MRKLISYTRQTQLDMLGISLSALCALHCGLILMSLLLLPTLKVGGILTHAGFHLTVIPATALIACWALVKGFWFHQCARPLWVAGAGIALLSAGHFLFVSWEALFFFSGALLIAWAHLLNWHYRAKREKE